MDSETLIQKWKAVYNDKTREDIADSLGEARQRKLTHYRNICSKHGEMIFYTKDNSCPVCHARAYYERVKIDKIFNRTRENFNGRKRKARSRNVEFSISLKDFRNMYTKTNVCPIFSVIMEHGTGDYAPSLDRIDPSRGYILDNVAIISNRANRVKSDGTAKEHLQIAAWLLQTEGKMEQVEMIRKISLE